MALNVFTQDAANSSSYPTDAQSRDQAGIWLPIQENPREYREFSLLVLLPQRELKDAPPFIHLGTQFLLEYGAQVFIDGSSISLPGKISIP